MNTQIFPFALNKEKRMTEEEQRGREVGED